MASAGYHDGRLDAAEREVVYCHSCAYEWHRDEYGLECPSCGSDITELVSLENDPRPALEDDSNDSDADSVHASETYRRVHDDEGDSDPEVADIDDHVDPNGFGHDQSTQVGEDAEHHDAHPRQSAERFLSIVSNIGMPLREVEGDGALMDRLREASRNGGGRVAWANDTSQGSVTFYTSNATFASGGNAPLGFEPFSSLFSSAFRDFGVQLTGEALQAAAAQGNGEGSGLGGNLAHILSLLNNGVHGDAVYSQEAFDGIVSVLMDANQQSSAAPPASEQGLANLPRKIIDEDLKSEDGNTECSICLDGMKVAEVTVSLPCNHSFHEGCAVAWLKEHNTCPVCRAPMEESARSRSAEELSQQQSQNQNESQNQRRGGQRHVPTPTDATGDEGEVQTGAAGSAQSASSTSQPALDNGLNSMPGVSVSSRPPNQSQTRLNEAMRLLSSQRGERDRSRGPSAGFSYDTSRLQRRSSMSPTGPRVAVGEGARSMRERSPSQSGRQTRSNRTGSGEEANTGAGAAMGWLRGRFVGGNGQQ